MNDPDVIVRVHRDADDGSEHPVVRQRLGPHRIHFEPRRLDAGRFGGRAFLQETSDPTAKRDNHSAAKSGMPR